jgi:hypothetical protein
MHYFTPPVVTIKARRRCSSRARRASAIASISAHRAAIYASCSAQKVAMYASCSARCVARRAELSCLCSFVMPSTFCFLMRRQYQPAVDLSTKYQQKVDIYAKFVSNQWVRVAF